MNILLLGSGGREHAFAFKIKQSPLLTKLWIAPGNTGTALCGENISLSPIDFPSIRDFVLKNNIHIVIVGPEDPLVRGIADFFRNDAELKNTALIGPSKQAAMLEGSKDFAKAFMVKYGIPTAKYQTFSPESLSDAKLFLKTMNPPYVLKADGLAAGKGVVICESIAKAEKELDDMLQNKKFGEASSKVVIEQFLEGIELSSFIVSDGDSYHVLPSAKDYKKIGEGDTGPNTGGMGAVSPVPFADEAFLKKVQQQIIHPTMEGLKKEGIEYVGFLFVGLMNVAGDPFVIEYNVRMGDPETEVVLPRIKTDLLQIMKSVADKNLGHLKVECSGNYAATIMLVSQGYPGDYEKGKIISGFENTSDCTIFHAGTKNENDDIVTNGGRVLAITSLNEEMTGAIHNSLNNAEKIQFEGKYFRKDIGADLLKYL